MAGFKPLDCIRGNPSRKRAVLALLAAASVLLTPVAIAQPAAPADAVSLEGQCQVYAVDGAREGVKNLLASCGGQGVLLGPVAEFATFDNEELGATLIDLQRNGERRVLLLSLQPDGRSLVEDLTGQIALAAGRGPMSAIDGVELGLEDFSRTGEISVRGLPGDNGSRKAEKVGLAPQIAGTRASRIGSAQD